MIKKQIPNCITLANLLCGTLSIYFLYVSDSLILPSVFILMGAVFDFCDGLTARLLKVTSAIGKELDSLADVVTFGLAPSLITVEVLKDSLLANHYSLFIANILCLIPMFMTLMSAYRLANFNVDERQTVNFIGLPTPANAFLWLSLPVLSYLSHQKIHLWGIYQQDIYASLVGILLNPWFIIVFSIIMGVMLVAPIEMFSFKFKNFKWQDNKVKFIFLVICILLIFALNCFAIPFIVLMYIIISLISNFTKKWNLEQK
jgi:CDP-diacylglycerol--serine O-phosphatidyltransferase